jgi:hypothetical protein
MMRRAMIAVIAMALGCVPVKPYQRGRLAKPKMQLQRDAQATEIEQHVYESREGSAGGHVGTGGGCGCN